MMAHRRRSFEEAQIMKLASHENILSLHCSFVHQKDLWMVMPYVKGGSVLNIMKFAHPQVPPPPPLPQNTQILVAGTQHL